MLENILCLAKFTKKTFNLFKLVCYKIVKVFPSMVLR